MACGFSTNGLDALLSEGLELLESICTPSGSAIVCCDNEFVSLDAVFVSRTRLIAWTKAAHVGAEEEKKGID
jgi:hypothetical protein